MDDLQKYINKLRYDFSSAKLEEESAEKDGVRQFEKWFREAVDAKANDPNAMCLSTATAKGKPASRIVLLRNFSDSGFVFYTNYNSRKGKEIGENPVASLLFFWPELQRQVRVEGILQKQTDTESDEYFASRPRSSQLGAWVSSQSSVIKDRKELDDAFAEAEKKFDGKDVPRPKHWGGFVLVHEKIEFWQGRPNRLHDRLLYSKKEQGWIIERLAP